MPRLKHALDLLEVPLGQTQRLDVFWRPPDVPILAVRSIDAEAAPVIVALPANGPTWVIALSGNVTFIDHVASALRGWS